ncbi:hypothetical protein RAN3_1240 [plant metagenome]|uniref:4-hydroxy-tetrahydrodipicolinate synthase n=1 Tax=plant metagenome TaxID=1297885 RepID=A0A484V999_9ZZZZ
MKTSAVSPADIRASVMAVPPLARHADLTLNPGANAALIRHIEAGGIRTLLYGGNANLYNTGLYEYASLLDMLAEHAGESTWVIPSAGPDYGTLMDQAPVLKARHFPAVMALPLAFAASPGGVARGLRLFAEAAGTPLLLYIKSEQYLTLDAIGALMDEGVACAIKYAVPREDPAQDAFLASLLDRVGTERVVCGLAETPVLTHMREFGLPSFTSGGVCIAPTLSQGLLKTAQMKDWAAAEPLRDAFLPFERQRERTGVFATMHDAVTLAGIADMGPLQPMLENLPQSAHAAVRPIAEALLAAEQQARQTA